MSSIHFHKPLHRHTTALFTCPFPLLGLYDESGKVIKQMISQKVIPQFFFSSSWMQNKMRWTWFNSHFISVPLPPARFFTTLKMCNVVKLGFITTLFHRKCIKLSWVVFFQPTLAQFICIKKCNSANVALQLNAKKRFNVVIFFFVVTDILLDNEKLKREVEALKQENDDCKAKFDAMEHELVSTVL